MYTSSSPRFLVLQSIRIRIPLYNRRADGGHPSERLWPLFYCVSDRTMGLNEHIVTIKQNGYYIPGVHGDLDHGPGKTS